MGIVRMTGGNRQMRRLPAKSGVGISHPVWAFKNIKRRGGGGKVVWTGRPGKGAGLEGCPRKGGGPKNLLPNPLH